MSAVEIEAKLVQLSCMGAAYPYSAETPSATEGREVVRLGPHRPIPVDPLEPGNEVRNAR